MFELRIITKRMSFHLLFYLKEIISCSLEFEFNFTHANYCLACLQQLSKGKEIWHNLRRKHVYGEERRTLNLVNYPITR